MKTHSLKTDPVYFNAVWNGRKKSELRKDDRDFRLGDNIILKEYDRPSEKYSGREIRTSISYITEHRDSLRDGFVMLCLDIGELTETFL